MRAERTIKTRAFVSVSEAAEALCVSPATVRRSVDDGRLVGYRLGGTRKVLRSAVQELVDRGKKLP